MGFKKIVFLIFLTVAILVGGYVFLKSYGGISQDLRLAYVDENGIVIKSISKQRRMVNIARVSSDVPVWVPGGLGWYEAGKIKKLLEQEKQTDKMDDILVFNFGFNPDMVSFSSESISRDWWQMGKVWGWRNLITYSLKGDGGLMTKEEKITGQLSAEKEFLTTIMQRDFADSQVIEEGIKASVYNDGTANGLAAVVARNMEWMGMTVYGVESVNREGGGEKCQLIYGDKVQKTKTWEHLKTLFFACEQTQDALLGEKEIELYLTDKYAEMINYQSYTNN